jgi:hypothetical protein
LYDACKRDHKILFSEYQQIKRSSGNLLVRVAMFKNVLNPKNTAERIFWSKNHLGMSDKFDSTVKTEITITPADVATLDPADASRELMEAMRCEG